MSRFWSRERCRKLIKHQGTNFEFGFSVDKVFSLSNLKISPQQLQKASKLAVIYDNYQFWLCQRYQNLREDDPRREKYHQKKERVLDAFTKLEAVLAVAEADPTGQKNKLDSAMEEFLKIFSDSTKQEDMNIQKQGINSNIESTVEIPEEEKINFNLDIESNEKLESELLKSNIIPSINIDRLINRAKYFRYIGNYEKAVEYYDRILDNTHSDVDILYDKGDMLYMMEKYEEAIKAFDKALDLDPGNVEMLDYKANVFLRLGKYDEAIEIFDKLIEISPENVNALFSKAKALFDMDKNQQAIDWFDKCTEVDPKYAEAWYYKACAFAKLQTYKEAISCINKAIDANSKVNDAFFKFKAAMLVKSERSLDEIMDPINALLKNSHDKEAWYAKGLLLISLEKYKEADEAFDKTLSIDSEDKIKQSPTVINEAEIWYQKGIAYKSNILTERMAIDCFYKATFKDPNYADAWAKIASLTYKVNEPKSYQEAIKIYDKALKMKPNDPEIWAGRGDVSAQPFIRNYRQAIDDYDKAIKLDQDYAYAWEKMAEALGTMWLFEDNQNKKEKYRQQKIDAENTARRLRLGLQSQEKHPKQVRAAKQIIEKWANC